ncbi:MAG: type II toxin-antitoxin system HipA family toxin [Desulfovibrio sp.]|nr:type II toxin-antitoxin system HipA family toxin [Desulfovibrio sp.]
MSQICYVFIYLPGEQTATPAGRLIFDGHENAYKFQYGRGFLKNQCAMPVDPLLLPLDAKPYILSPDILGSIRDAAPDGWGRLVIEKSVGRSDFNEIDYLLQPNAERVGNLDFRIAPNVPSSTAEPPSVTDLPKLIEAAEAVENEEKLTPQLRKYLPLLRQGSSLGGARPKSVVRADDGLWLAKFPAKGDKWNNTRIEHATMRIAALSGIHVPETKILKVCGRDILLIRRFDRNNGRTGYLSALTMLNIAETDYKSFSYLSLADKMRKLNMGNQLQELFLRIAFNIICRNTDDHPRNHGFLIHRNVMELSPAFDITPTASIKGVSSIPFLAMALGERGKEGTLHNLLSQVGRFGLTREEGKAVFVRTQGTVRNEWEKIFSEAGVSSEDAAKFQNTFQGNFDEEKQDSCRPSFRSK